MDAMGVAGLVGGIGRMMMPVQEAPPPPPPIEAASDGEIIVTGKRERGSAILDIAPVAVLDAEAIRSLGAPNVAEIMKRLQALTTSSGGGKPVYLLNGLRVSGPEELFDLPSEAIEKTEILSEQDAARFGYPTTVRVVNFITKKDFRAVSLQQLAGTTTEGGGASNYAEATSTRIAGPRRMNLTVSHFRQNRVLQSQRDIVPDPDALFAIPGNALAADGSGRILGTRSITDIGPFRTLQPRNDTIRVNGTMASPIGRTISGSVNLSMEAQRNDALNGLAPAALRVPAGNPALPYSEDALLYRYLPGVTLGQRSTNLNLHAGTTLQGGYRRWSWNATTSFDRVQSVATSDQGVPLNALQTAIDAGGDPFATPDPATAAARLRNDSRTITGTLVSKAVVNGPLLRLPAGDALVTVTTDYARSASEGSRPAAPVAAIAPAASLTRITKGASVALDLPILSSTGDLLPFLGRLSATGTIGVSGVSDYGRLVNSSYGIAWTPTPPLQITASVNESRTPPAIALLTDPILTAPNTPYFDFATGSTVAVTTVSGGNRSLAPEERRIVTIGASLKPIKTLEARIGLDYLNTRTLNQTASFNGATVDAQLAFPGLFRRDAFGQLTRVDLRPVNLARETEQKLRMTINLYTELGPKPAPPAPKSATPDPSAPPPAPPKRRPSLYVFGTATWRFDDRLNLQPGSPTLDLLDGASLNGTQGRPRWEVDGNIGSSIGAVNLGIYGRLQGQTRIRSALAASDLRFSGRTWLVVYGRIDVSDLVDRPWTKRMSLDLAIENLLNDRIDVRDRMGATPNRFQGAYIDPIGRSIRLGVRKLF